MSSERKILKANRSQKKDYINSLPDEVLIMIFDGLDGASVKQASAVCQRWNSIIFLSSYICRFTLRIDIEQVYSIKRTTDWFMQESVITHNSCEARQKLLIGELIDLLTKSQRCYRKLVWRLKNWTTREFESAWQALHPKVTNHLHSLSFSGKNAATNLFLSIVETIPSMSKLQSLSLTDWCFRTTRIPIIQKTIPTLCNTSVTHMKMKSEFKFRFNMPKLRSLECTLSALYRPETSSELLVLSKLQHLIVLGQGHNEEYFNMITADPFLFQRLTNLETMKWTYLPVPAPFLLNICETCTTLKELYFEGGLLSFDPTVFSKLPNLRVLGFGLMWFGPNVPTDLSSFTQLEEVYLYSVPNPVTLPKSVRKLTVTIYMDNRECWIRTLFRLNKHLTELQIELVGRWKCSFLHKTLNALSILKNLEVLKFHDVQFNESCPVCGNPPLDHIRKLYFIRSIISRQSVKRLQERFPNLEDIQIIKHCSDFGNSDSE